jgi:hypothetical protein
MDLGWKGVAVVSSPSQFEGYVSPSPHATSLESIASSLRMWSYIYTYQLLSGEYDYQYQLGQNAAQNSTPRGAAIPEHVAVLPTSSTSHSREYYDNQDYDYQERSQTSNEVNDLSGDFAATSLNDELLPPTGSASHIEYKSKERQQGRLPSRSKNLELGR